VGNFLHFLVKITRISKAEENALGVNEDLMKSHREQYGVPDSENLLELQMLRRENPETGRCPLFLRLRPHLDEPMSLHLNSSALYCSSRMFVVVIMYNLRVDACEITS